MKKLNTSALLALSSTALSDLSPKSPKFIINDEEFEVDILVKALSYDEVTNMFKGEDPEKITVADVVKRRVLLTVFNADTKKPLCSTIEEVGNLHLGQLGIEPGADLAGWVVKHGWHSQTGQNDIDAILQELDQLFLADDSGISLLEQAVDDS